MLFLPASASLPLLPAPRPVPPSLALLLDIAALHDSVDVDSLTDADRSDFLLEHDWLVHWLQWYIMH